MTKHEWTIELKKHLAPLPLEDLARTLEYYDELFADKLEAGLGESQILYSFGNPSDAAKKILDEHALYPTQAQTSITPIRPDADTAPPAAAKPPKVRQPQGNYPIWMIPLAIIGGLILLGPAIGVLATIFAVFVSVWAIVGSLLISGAAIALSGLIAIVMSFYSMATVGLGSGLVQLGISIAAIGVGIILFVASFFVLKLWIKVNIAIIRWIGRNIKRVTDRIVDVFCRIFRIRQRESNL